MDQDEAMLNETMQLVFFELVEAQIDTRLYHFLIVLLLMLNDTLTVKAMGYA